MKADRRDHPAQPKGDGDYDWCIICGDRVATVYDRHLKVSSRTYWRHIRRATT